MNENMNQPEQDYAQVGKSFPCISDPLSDQDPTPSDDSPYEDTHEPYLRLPSESPQQPAWQTSPAPVADSQAADASSSSPPGDTATTLPFSTLIDIRVIILLTLIYVVLLVVIFKSFHAVYQTFWVALLLTSFYAMVMVSTVYSFYVRRMLYKKGVTIEGCITGRQISFGYRGITYHYLTYSYKCDGCDYSHEETVAPSIFNTLIEGDSVHIRYLPEKPMIAGLFDPKLNRLIAE